MATILLTLRLLMLSCITLRRQLIHNRTASRSRWNKEYDFIVVGAGTAGCVVANRLAQTGKVSVLLLEAGGAQSAIYNDIPTALGNITLKRPDLQWNYVNEPQNNVGLQFPENRMFEKKGKTIGGCSTHNGMLFNRGNAKDFDEWETEYGADGWSFKDVLPFFRKFENNLDPHILSMSPRYHGIGGPVQVSTPKNPGKGLITLQNVYNSLGYATTDMNGANQSGTMMAQLFIQPNGLRSGSGTAYVDPNLYPKTLHIVCKALVTKILFSGLTAVGVEFVKNNKSFTVNARNEVIISGGPINSPQLLMLSGVGPKDHLLNFNIPVVSNLPVGSNMSNHFGVGFSSPPGPNLTVQSLSELYFHRRGELTEFSNLLTYYSTKGNPKDRSNVILKAYTSFSNKSQVYTILEFVRMRSKGTIRLQSTDPDKPPLIASNFLSNPKDLEDVIDAIKFYFFVMDLPTVSPYAVVPTFESYGCPSCPGMKKYECDEGIKCLIKYSGHSDLHPSGTCRMGAVKRKDIVVDPKCRVKGCKNLRVCDSSIFPSLLNGNPNAATLMIGEKCAQIIKNFYHL